MPEWTAGRGGAFRKEWPILLGLAAVTVLAYARLFGNEFVNFDDTIYVYQNRWVQQGLTWESIRWAFGFDQKHGTYWQPLTWLSLMLDHELFGLNPAGYHGANLLLHVANVCLLFGALRRMTGNVWCSALVAAVFGVHPINVESVAWAAERKNVISSLFWMLTLHAYLRYLKRPTWYRYLLVPTAMALGLLAKSMLVTLPAVLLLLDFWPLERVRLPGGSSVAARPKPSIPTLIVEKLPLVVLSVLSVAVSTASITGLARARSAATALPLGARVSEALVSYVRYIGKLVWPADLAVFYPSEAHYPAWEVLGSILLLAGATALALELIRRAPWVLTGWLWFLGVLLPVAGLVRVGLWPALADRFAYLPSIGLFLVVGVAAAKVSERGRAQRIAVSSLAVAVVGALGVQTSNQVGYWHDSITLFTHTLSATRDNSIAYVNLANAVAKAGREQEAIEYLHRALEISPRDHVANANLADALRRAGRLDEAIAHYRQALREGSFDDAILHCNLGVALQQAGRLDEAIAEYRAALAIDPGYVNARYDLAIALAERGDHAGAILEYREVLRVNPTSGEAHNNLGLSLARAQRLEEAIAEYDEAIRLTPADAFPYYNKGDALAKLGRRGEAMAQLREALRLNPGDADAARDLRRLLAEPNR